MVCPRVVAICEQEASGESVHCCKMWQDPILTPSRPTNYIPSFSFRWPFSI